MGTTAAPKLNKIAISPPAPALGTDPERVAAAIHFGAALQELIARGRLQRTGPSAGPGAPRGSGPRFPADLSDRRRPEDSLRTTFEKLRKLERIVISEPQRPQIDAMMNGSANEAESETMFVPETEGPWGPGAPHPHVHSPYSPGDAWVEPGSPDQPALREGMQWNGQAGASSPSEQLGRKIEDLLEAYREDESLDNLHGHLSGAGGLDDLVEEWDAYVVESVAVSAPRTLTGYKVGKALGLTRWGIWAARYQTPADEGSPSKAWNDAFGARRVREVQRQINALSDVLNPAALTIVATSLGYWRHALLSLQGIIAGSGRRQNRTQATARRSVIEVPDGKGDQLEEALERQLDNWLDLLTGRRAPESFSVAGIVATLTKDLTEELAAGLGARIGKYIVPVFALIALTAILATVAVAVFFLSQPQSGDVTGGQVGGLAATGLVGIIASLVVRGRALLDRGAGAFDQILGRIDDLDNRLGGASDQATRPVSRQDIKEDALSQLVGQIRLEELNIAVSEPLVNFVLALNDDESDDPKEDAQRFLRLAYGDRSNLDRLLPVFKDLYKHFRTSPQG